MSYPSERLAYWYFRLNGFLTTENFIVHPDFGQDQRTDADLLAVRFSNRAENHTRPMVDDPKVATCAAPINVVIAEVKTTDCALNGAWTNPAKENMHRVLRAIGCIEESQVANAADSLYKSGVWSDELTSFRLFAVGKRRAELIVPLSQQIIWSEVIEFCVERFHQYRNEKSSVGQWTPDGIKLRTLALRNDVNGIRALFGLSGVGDAD